jgi:Holliday junction resolvase RusA-like endonuclease
MKIIIQGELTDLNTYIKALNSHRFAGNALKQEETDRVYYEAIKQRREPILSFPVHVSYVWYCQNARKDTDNVSFAKKFILDGIVKAGVLPDDSRKYVASDDNKYLIDKDNPRVEVYIKEKAP